MEKATFMKQSIKHLLAWFLVFCMMSSPLHAIAAVIHTSDEEGYEKGDAPLDVEEGGSYTIKPSSSVGNDTRLTSNTTLFAKEKLSAERYVVNYNGNGADGGMTPSGSIKQMNSQVIVAGNPNSLYKAGKVLEGWTVGGDRSGTVYREGNTYRVEKSTIFYANWIDSDESQSKLIYNKNGGEGTVANTMEYHINSMVTVSGNLKDELYRKGYEFTGWTTDAGGTGVLYKAGSKIQLKADTILYARWKADAIKYTLTYNGNKAEGGIAPATVGSIELSDRIDVTPNAGSLYKAGYAFKGWSLNVDGRGDLYPASGRLPIRRNTILYAVWEADMKLYSITYGANEGMGEVPAAETNLAMGKLITVKGNIGDLYKVGNKFEGWTIVGDTTGHVYKAGETFVLTGITTLNAKWSEDAATYTVTYHSNFASGIPAGDYEGMAPVDPMDYPVNDKVAISANTGDLFMIGLEFDGWNSKADGTGTVYKVGETFRITTDRNLYAKWKLSNRTTTLSYDSNGATKGKVPASQTVLAGRKVTVAGIPVGLERPGWKTLGWAETAEATVPMTATEIRVTENKVLYAVWEECAVTLTITLQGKNAAGGTVMLGTIVLPMELGETKVFNPAIDLPMPAGWRFQMGQNKNTTFGPAVESGTKYEITVFYRPAL